MKINYSNTLIIFILYNLINLIEASSLYATQACHDLAAQYPEHHINYPGVCGGVFTETQHSTYFSSNEINKRQSSPCYVYNSDFWSRMDNLRSNEGGPIVLSSAYRSPDYNAGLKGSNPKSLHQYSDAADITRIDGVSWSDMSASERSDFIDAVEAQGLEYDNRYQDHLHVEYDTGTCNIFLLSLTASELESWVFSEEDELILRHADWYSAMKTAHRVDGLLHVKGRDAVRDAVPALIHLYRKNRAIPQEQITEGDMERGLYLLKLLNRIGDIRSKDVLLEGVKYSPNMWKGFLVIGHSVIPSLVDSLSRSSDVLRRIGAMHNLRNMAEGAPDFFTQQELSLIHTRLIESLGDEDGVVRRGALRALEVFGDESIMSLLERITAQDEYIHPFKGTYSNRVAAQKTIEAIRARLQSELDLDKTKDE